MFWKLITGLLGERHQPARGVTSSSSEPGLTDQSTSNDIAGKLTGNSLEELVGRADTLAKAGQLTAALECYRVCVQTYPRGLRAYLGMGNVLVDLWSIDEAVAVYGNALELAPYSGTIFSALLFNSHYLVSEDQRRLFDLHRRFGEMMRKTSTPKNERFALVLDAGRPLRIGYVSPNFSRHSVGYFFEPVINHHDRERYKIYCYYTHQLSDETTERIRRSADCWRHVADKNDDQVETIIRNDGIDILVDLAGHSKGNRLGVFAKKPAPIQMTWLGYPDTTGLYDIDFRITDRIADPDPAAEQWYTERLSRINDLFLCYQPPPDSPPIRERPGPASEVVFSSFNSIAKLNTPVIQAWAGILAGVSGSRIVLKSASLKYPDTVDRVLECLEANGIDSRRIQLHGWIEHRHEHLKLYNEVDIALDTFPYNGTTTTCEALWMGVPVVSLAGSVHMSRVGRTILQCVGLPTFVAESVDEYIDIAVTLARDQYRRQSLRTQLRPMLMSSPLLDHAGFTRKLEHHFRHSWTAWCGHQHVVLEKHLS